jgi:dynein heavy chain
MLTNAAGDILDDVELIEELTNSKIMSKNIESKLEQQNKVRERIKETRKEYTPVAFRAATLFFTVSDLRSVEPMY